MEDNSTNTTPAAEIPAAAATTPAPAAETPAAATTPVAAAETATPAPATPAANDTTSMPEEKGLIFPNADDADAVLAFRKSCGYPDDAAGYGLPMDTEEQKNLANFLHKCQLDPIAAKVIAKNAAEVVALEEQNSKQAFTENYNKLVESWGENKKENEMLVNKGLSLTKLDQDKLRAISDNIGVEAAISMMMLIGKTQTDYSGVSSGANSDDSDSILGYVARKRG